MRQSVSQKTTAESSGGERVHISWRPVYALCVSQVISWGTLYYAFSVLLDPIGKHFAWRQDQMVGAFSLSLLLTGAATFAAGMLLQKWSGRAVMSIGSVLAAASLAGVALSTSLLAFYLSWAAAGIAMGGTLYETAFSVLAGIYESNYKRAVTTVTLAGGFASTLFWPLTERLVAGIGWRGTLWCYVVLHLLIGLPLHHFAIPGSGHSAVIPGKLLLRAVGSLVRTTKFQLLMASYTFNAIVFSAISVHLIPSFQERGMDAQQAAWLAATAGPMQVFGRAIEFRFGSRWTASQTGTLAMAILVPALLILSASPVSIPVVVLGIALYGISNGVMTIVRSVSIAETFGREKYSMVSGAMAGPAIISRAAGPFLASVVLATAGGYPHVLWLMALLSAVALITFWYGTR